MPRTGHDRLRGISFRASGSCRRPRVTDRVASPRTRHGIALVHFEVSVPALLATRPGALRHFVEAHLRADLAVLRLGRGGGGLTHRCGTKGGGGPPAGRRRGNAVDADLSPQPHRQVTGDGGHRVADHLRPMFQLPSQPMRLSLHFRISATGLYCSQALPTKKVRRDRPPHFRLRN